MYLGEAHFVPLSLLGLLFDGTSVASSKPISGISVIVPVRNGGDTIERCIRSIEKQTHPVYEVIVIDDASTDETPTILGRLWGEYGNIRIFRNFENLGKAASISKVLPILQTPLTAIVDADTFLDKDYFLEVSKVFHRKDIIAASGTVLPTETEGVIERSRLIEYLHSQSTYKKLQEKVGAIFVTPGCCSIWRTEWLKKNGIPTDTVVEDMDLTWGAQVEGGKIAFIPNGVAYTNEPKSLVSFTRQTYRWFSWRPVLKKYWKKLNLKMKILIIWMLIENIAYIAWFGIITYLLLLGDVISAFLLLLIDVSVVTAIALWQGCKFKTPLRKVFSSIPRYYSLKVPTAFLFWKAFIKPKRAGW